MVEESVRLDGHIIDSLTLSKVMDLILTHGGTYEITNFQIGRTKTDASHAEISVRAPSQDDLESILHLIGQHGAVRPAHDVEMLPAPADGVFPEGFYSTTNLETAIRLSDRWVPVERTEMDCGIVVRQDGAESLASCVPLHRVKQRDQVVVGDRGVRVTPVPRRDPSDVFSFMGSEVSSERPKELIVAATVQAMREVRATGRKIVFVGGPAIVHTGAGPQLEAIIHRGWIDVLFAGNALATHDIERALYGTSLGVDLETGAPAAHGHEHHLRAINAIRAVGGIRPAVESGLLSSGIMHACVVKGVDFVLAGSIRDDGPLPDVITDSVEAQDAMRERVRDAGIAIMVATTLHSVATGNLLPASVRTICVDSDADSVIKLMDRGTHQAFGLVTDCEFFLKELAGKLGTT